MSSIRKPAVAGQFYPRSYNSLLEMIEEKCFKSKFGPGKLPKEIGEHISEKQPFVVVPHAGYIYSGPTAAWSYLELSKYEKPEIVVVLGPNHWGFGPDVAVPRKVEAWETPLGVVELDHEFIQRVEELSHVIGASDDAHAREHSIEVQLPFLQYIYGNDFKFVPIALKNQSMDMSILLGEILAKAAAGKNVVIVASSDLTHYEPHEYAKEKDYKVLKTIEKMNLEDMYTIKYELNISMCGYGAIGTTIEAAKRLHRTKGKILSYSTSGDTSGMKNQVVGYGSVAFYANNN